MHEFAYFDLFDTENAARYVPEKQGNRVRECAHQQAMLATLRGWTPVFSQGQGIDSLPLLSILLEKNEREPFLYLVRNGFIKILLWEHDDRSTLVDRAIRDFQEEDPLFGVWIELNKGKDGSRPPVAKKELIEAIRTGKPKSSFSETLNGFVFALHELSAAIGEAKPTRREEIERQPYKEAARGAMLTETLRELQQGEQNPVVATALQSLLFLQSERRTVLLRSLRRMEELPEDVRTQAENLVNIALNSATARCVHSQMNGLNATAGTTDSCQSAASSATKALSGAQLSNISAVEQKVLREGIARCTWEEVKDFVAGRRGFRDARWQNDLMTSGLVACCATEEGTKLGLVINTLARGPKEVVEKGIESALEAHGVDSTVALVLGGAAGELVNMVLSESQITANLRDLAKERLTKRFYGLLRESPDNVPMIGFP